MVLNSRQLHHFLAVVDHGSLGRAAKALHISEPAISKSVRILEDALQVKLFDRSPRGLEPTNYGEALVSHARIVAIELKRAIVDVHELRGAQTGHVHVGAGPSFAASVVPRAVSQLRAARPGVRVTISEGYAESIVPRVLRGELDVAVMTLEAARPDPDLVQERLGFDDVIIVARSQHPLAGRPVELTELQKCAWTLTRRPDLLRVQLEEIFTRAELQPPDVAVEFASLNFACTLLRQEDVLSFLPRSFLSSDLLNGTLVQLDVPGSTWQRSVGLVYRRHRSHSPACQALLKEIRELDRQHGFYSPAAEEFPAQFQRTRGICVQRRRYFAGRALRFSGVYRACDGVRHTSLRRTLLVLKRFTFL